MSCTRLLLIAASFVVVAAAIAAAPRWRRDLTPTLMPTQLSHDTRQLSDYAPKADTNTTTSARPLSRTTRERIKPSTAVKKRIYNHEVLLIWLFGGLTSAGFAVLSTVKVRQEAERLRSNSLEYSRVRTAPRNQRWATLSEYAQRCLDVRYHNGLTVKRGEMKTISGNHAGRN